MRTIFLGNAPWSVPSLEAVAGSNHELVRVLTRIPKPAGRGGGLRPTAVADAARRLGLPLAEIETVRSGQGAEALRAVAFDVLAVVAYGEILRQDVLDLPAVAPVNVHFSLLPELRGAAPVQRALSEGLVATGVTTIRMDAGMDSGPILLQAVEQIDPNDDAGSLGERLAAVGGRLLVDTLDRLEAGAVEERAQPEEGITFAPKFKPEERVLDWTREAETLVRLVRALSPEEGAATRFRNRGLTVFRATARDNLEGAPNAEPGTVVFAGKRGFAVKAGDGAVALEEVGPEGRKRMPGSAFVNGFRPELGERLG